jgi:hypothetical protein
MLCSVDSFVPIDEISVFPGSDGVMEDDGTHADEGGMVAGHRLLIWKQTNFMTLLQREGGNEGKNENESQTEIANQRECQKELQMQPQMQTDSPSERTSADLRRQLFSIWQGHRALLFNVDDVLPERRFIEAKEALHQIVKTLLLQSNLKDTLRSVRILVMIGENDKVLEVLQIDALQSMIKELSDGKSSGVYVEVLSASTLDPDIDGNEWLMDWLSKPVTAFS